MTNGNGRGFTLGLLCGVAVGAALGVLFAPKAGAATRRDLARSADGMRLRGMELYEGGVEAAATLSGAVGDLADHATELVTGAVTQAKKTPGRAKSA